VYPLQHARERIEPALDWPEHCGVTPLDPALERAARSPLHHDPAARGIGIEDAHHTRAGKLHRQTRLAFQLFAVFARTMIDLERDAPAERFVERFVHGASTAAPRFADDPEAGLGCVGAQHGRRIER
jgi:hypothetical protein